MKDKTSFKGSVLLNPVPVVIVSSKNKKGISNIFTVAWTGTICTEPPMLSISIRPERLSYDFISETMEFIVNIPSRSLTWETDYCGVRSGRLHNKIEEMKFDMIPGSHVNVDYINQCPVNIECRVTKIIKLGSHDIFLAEVLQTHIKNEIIDENGKFCFEKANLISYCHGEYFPLSEAPIGKFGYSVVKSPKIIKEYKEKYGKFPLLSKKIKQK